MRRRFQRYTKGQEQGSGETRDHGGDRDRERASWFFLALVPPSPSLPFPHLSEKMRDARCQMPDARCDMPDATCDMRHARREKEDARDVPRGQPSDEDVPSLARRFLDRSSLALSDFSALSFFLSSGTPSSTCAQSPANVSLVLQRGSDRAHQYRVWGASASINR